jgi:APA family basic amino acid/polyamine antiporter
MPLHRTLGLREAVAIGLGAMIGAGLFAVWAPATAAAGEWVLLSLLLAGVVALCNALSSAALAARYPSAGGTYVYGRERLGELPGFLAGWCFVVGKTASCAAMALTIGAYAVPGQERPAAVVAVLVVTALNLAGVTRSARASEVIVAVVLSVLAGLVVAALLGDAGPAAAVAPPAGVGPFGVLQAAGLLFFAFAGYARIATLGEEVRDPSRTIPRAVVVALAVVALVYAVVGVLVLQVLGAGATATSAAPLAEVAEVVWGGQVLWLVRLAATAAAFGALLNLVLGISRTGLAMARGHHLPAALARVDERRGVPWVAELVVGAVVLAVVLVVDLRGAIGFSSFGVLLYYAVANAAAWTLRGDWGPARTVPVLGLVGCLVLAATLPTASVVGGLVVLALGLLWYAVVRRGAPA